MAVVEYMLHADGPRRQVPEFIGDRGHWYNPADHTYVGWVSDSPDFYVPDTIVSLTKEAFVSRALSIHAANPLRKMDSPVFNPGEEPVFMTDAEVTTHAETWYDNFVTTNTGK
jgi:hypothetical protein